MTNKTGWRPSYNSLIDVIFCLLFDLIEKKYNTPNNFFSPQHQIIDSRFDIPYGISRALSLPLEDKETLGDLKWRLESYKDRAKNNEK